MRFGDSSPQAGSRVRPSSPSVVGGALTPGFKGKAKLGGERFRLAASSPPTEKGAQWPLPPAPAAAGGAALGGSFPLDPLRWR